MLRSLRCIALVGLMATMITLSGCPVTTPDLSVTPLALNFGANENTKTLRIQNQGGGTLDWEVAVAEGAPWLTLEALTGTKQAQLVEGQSTTEVDTIELRVNRAVLAESTSRNASVVVTSNAGNQTIGVTVTEGGAALLQIAPTTLSFGTATDTMDVLISNAGFEALSWSFTIPDNAPWLSASLRQNTNLQNGSADSVTFTVNRAGLPGGNYTAEIPVTSNGGSSTITVSMSVPPLTVSTNLIDFGTLTQSANRTFTVSNPSDAVVGVEFAIARPGTDAVWFNITNPVSLIDPLDSATLQVAANPAGLDPGIYTGSITVSSAALNFSHVITVRLEVPGISVSPELVEFGEITESATGSFALENLTPNPLPFTITVPSGNPWLNISPASGTLTNTQAITVTADPENADAGSYEVDVTIRFGDATSNLTETVTITMSRPEPARLEASPKSIFFGTSLIERRVAIWNVGIGTVDWEIDSSTFPAWLAMTPVDGGGIADGTVTGDATDEVVLRVDRGQVPDGVFEVSHEFEIVASGDATNRITISLNLSVAQVPEFVIEADSVDDRGVSTLVVPAEVESRTFVIRNEGTGVLTWAFGVLPEWVASISPSQGSLNSNVQQTVTLTVDRTGLRSPGEQAVLEIATNDPDDSVAQLDVAVSVPPVVAIVSDKAALGFQSGENAKLLLIANDGDPGTILNYQAVTNEDWLSISPATGTSEGTLSTIKDFQEHSVTVDRSRLDGAGSSARIIISAILIEDGVAVPDPSVTPIEVTVTVEASPLTIESALPHTRVPSLVRNVLMMRNIRSEAIPIPNSRLEDIGNLFRITESNRALDLTETNQFLKKDYTANILILLDFSGSMLKAANTVLADGQLGDPGALTEDALKTLYLRCIPELLDELPAHYRVGLGIFNDHALPESGVVRIITDNDGEPEFTRDKAILANRLNSIDVDDNGATDLFLAIESGASILIDQDLNDNLRPFDDADVKGLIVFTDGRDTSLSRVTETANLITAQGVRLFMVGWGEKVEADPMIRLSATTGGHYYSTNSRSTDQLDPFGVPIRVPLVSELADICSLDGADECDESLPNDLDSQVVLSYTTLNQQPSVVVAADITFNDPNDQNTQCLPEQGDITSGVVYRQQDFSTIAGDVRLGQISLRTEGISGGEATVFVRADYVPRNITEIEFAMSVTSLETPTINVSRVAQTSGGLASNWNLVEGPIGTYTLSSPDGEPFRFSDFGDLLAVRVTNVTQAFTLNFEVTSPLYTAGNFETKYFTHPDSIIVGGSPFLGTSFPAAFFDSRPAPLDVDGEFVVVADADTDQVEIDVFNLGGGHVAPGSIPDPLTGEFDPEGLVNVGLFWEAAIGSESNFLSFEENTQQSGFVTSSFDPSTMFINLNRASVPPGLREGEVLVNYSSGSVNSSGTLDPLQIRYTIQNPVFLITSLDNLTGLQIPVDFISFGFTPDSQEIRVRNTGQSTLLWEVNAAAFPTWLELSDIVGAAGPDEESVVVINIIREFVPEGESEFDIVFSADFADPITLRVGVEGLPDP